MNYAQKIVNSGDGEGLRIGLKIFFWFTLIVWGPIVLFVLGVLLGWFVFV